MAEENRITGTVLTASAAETEEAGRALGRRLLAEGERTRFIALFGDLGAGKTAFVRGLAAEITPGARVSSPTYTVVNEYRGGGRTLYHMDFYRIENEDDLESIGFYEYRGLIAAEWCEKVPYALPERYLAVRIVKTGDDTREITMEEVSPVLSGGGDTSEALF